MELNFSVDLDSEKVTIIYDDCSVLTVEKLEDDSFKFVNFNKVDDEEVADKIKKFATSLLS
jgi:hypothetical protein